MKRLVLVVLLAFAPAAFAADQPPSLVVVISIDQMRYDYLERFKPYFSQGGFNRFLDSGATFPNTHYLHAVTFTGPGHATIGSGKVPMEHTIAGNHWFERGTAIDTKRWDWYFTDVGGYAPPVKNEPDASMNLWFLSEQGSPRYCVYDDSVSVSAGKTTGMSPRSLAGEGLGDRVKAKYPGARVIGIALKDRAAILMAGRNADAAYWFDQNLPGFISSTYYKFDPALFAFNSTVPGYMPGSHQWNPSPFIPPDDLKRVTFDPPQAWPLKNTRYGGTFPHPVNNMRALTYSPFGIDLAFDFAMYAIAAESLGSRTGTPDVLFVSISSTDYYGHYYGPDSMEVADGMVRLDRSIERFLKAIDRRLGDRVVVALTADHGVQPTPEILKLREPNADTGRIDLRNPDKMGQRISDLPPLRIEIEKQLAAKLRIPFSAGAPYSHALVYFFEEPSLYINMARVRELQLDPERVKRALRDVVMTIDGVEHVWTNTELAASKAGGVERMARVSYVPNRTGDIYVTLRPNWIWTWGSNSTTHGQPVENDTHVPLLFWGAGVKSGRYGVPASPNDLARTLGAMLGVEVGGVDAKVLPVFSTTTASTSSCCVVSGALYVNVDVVNALQAALQKLDPSGTQPLVAGAKLSPEGRAAAASVRRLIEDAELPPGTIRVDSIEIRGDRATVVLWTGPLRKPRPGEALLDCGTGHSYQLDRVNGQWQVVSTGIMKC